MAEIKRGGPLDYETLAERLETPAERMVRLIRGSPLGSKPTAWRTPTPPGDAGAGFRRAGAWHTKTHQTDVNRANQFTIEQAKKPRP